MKEGAMNPRKKAVAGLAIAGSLAVALVGVGRAEDEDSHETAIAWEQLPEAVQQTVRDEAGDHAIRGIESVRDEDVVVYQAEWIDGENEVEVRVAADGKLLGRETEKADADDDGPDHGEEDDD
jgi:hypothetical protein